LIATVPHKFGLAAHCATLTDRAAFPGSVNVARRNADGTWHGDQVDGAAFVAACRADGATTEGARALQVGAGGAGSAIALALLDAGVAELTLHDADPARLDALAGRLRGSETGSPSARRTPPASGSSPTPPPWACARATRCRSTSRVS
jgi:shikimate dehydrogenase